MESSEKPPEGGKQGTGGASGGAKVSFRDMVLGKGGGATARSSERVDLIAHKLAQVEFDDGNRRLPKVFVADSVIENVSIPWKDALVIKVLGKNLGYSLMRRKLQAFWKPKGGFEIIDIDHGVFMVKFDLSNDRENVLKGGPWMVFDRCLAVSTWTLDFVTSDHLVMKTMVWIRFSGLNPAYYDQSILFTLASSVGVPIKADVNTTQLHQGRYARMCVEIDLSQPVAMKVWFCNQWVRVEYGGIHIICEHCGCYGHLGRHCEVLAAERTDQMRGNDKVATAHKGHANPSSLAAHGTLKSHENSNWTE
ncbi:hypothetical protein OROGR_005625 [Orobanche gracilis]